MLLDRQSCLRSRGPFACPTVHLLAMIKTTQPQPDVDVWPQASAHESKIVEPVLMPPVDDVARAVTPGGAASTMAIDTFINAFKKPLQQPILSSPPRIRITKIPGEGDDDDEGFVPKRSARLAAKSKFRAQKPGEEGNDEVFGF